MARRFLVATTHHLLAIEPQCETLWRIHSGAGLYFGLAVDSDGLLYAACRNSILGPENDQARAAEQGSILVFDREFRLREELRPEFPLRDVHGIAYFDSRLWVTCSYDNMVAIYDLAKRAWSRWYPAPDPAHRDRDIHHFNSIRFLGGQLCLLAHNFGASSLLFYDYPSLQLDSAVSFGAMAHDLFYFGGAIATCSSGVGCILNRNGQRLRTGGFPRGVETTSAGNLLGISIESRRNLRQQQDGILRWYTPDWQFRADYVLPHVGMVLDILDIGDYDGRWNFVEPWPHAEVARGNYNRLDPGNLYGPNSFDSCTRSTALEWHTPEGTHRWMAARSSGFSVLVNPGEKRLWVEVGSANPNPYSVEISFDQHILGTLAFATPGIQRHEFCITPDSAGTGSLTFRVPYLWRPADLIPGSTDNRLLGVSVHLVGVDYMPSQQERLAAPPALRPRR